MWRPSASSIVSQAARVGAMTITRPVGGSAATNASWSGGRYLSWTVRMSSATCIKKAPGGITPPGAIDQASVVAPSPSIPAVLVRLPSGALVFVAIHPGCTVHTVAVDVVVAIRAAAVPAVAIVIIVIIVAVDPVQSARSVLGVLALLVIALRILLVRADHPVFLVPSRDVAIVPIAAVAAIRDVAVDYDHAAEGIPSRPLDNDVSVAVNPTALVDRVAVCVATDELPRTVDPAAVDDIAGAHIAGAHIAVAHIACRDPTVHVVPFTATLRGSGRRNRHCGSRSEE